MTGPSSIYVTITPETFCTERESAHVWVDGKTADDGHFEDCVNCSLLNLASCAKPGIPNSHKEAELLRYQAGLPALHGTSVGQYAKAMHDRYGLDLVLFAGTDAELLAAIPVGYGAAVGGTPHNCASTSPFRRFLQNYTGGHCVVLLHLTTDLWWLVDPMGYKDGKYQGQAVSVADIKTFYTGGAGRTGILPLALAPKEEFMLTGIDAIDPITFDAPLGVQVLYEDGTPAFKTTVPIVTRNSPYGVPVAGKPHRVFAGKDGKGVRRLFLVDAAAITNVKPLGGGFTQAELDAAAAAAAATQKARDVAAVQGA